MNILVDKYTFSRVGTQIDYLQSVMCQICPQKCFSIPQTGGDHWEAEPDW